MAGEAIRSLYAEIGFDIDNLPLRKLDKILDEVKEKMLGGTVERFERDMRDANTQTKKTSASTKQLGSAVHSASKQVDHMSGRFKNLRNSADNTFRSIRSGLGSVARSAMRAPFSLPGMLLGGGAVFGIGALATKSIGGAAELEMQGLQLEALIGDATKAKKLFDSMNVKGMKSVFSERDFLEGAKSFLPLTKDLKQIDKLTSLQERLAASNPTEGMIGSAFAIREAMSGDTVSLAERFNIPKTMLTTLRKATSMNGKVEELDKILTQMGFTQEYLTKVNESAAAQWDNLKSNMDMKLKRSGARALEQLKPFLKDLNTFLGSERANRMFDRWGQALGKAAQEAANFGRWLMDEGGKAFDYIDRNYLSNPEFQKLPFNEKIDEVFTDIKGKFDAWYQNEGKQTMEDGAQKFVDFTLGVIANNLPAITSMGTDVGKSLGSGILTGFTEFARQHPELAALMAGAAVPGPVPVKIGAAAAAVGAPVISDEIKNWKSDKPVWKKVLDSVTRGTNKIPGKASGMPFVPHNDFLIRAHEGERVLTAQENRDYSKDRHSSDGGSWGMPPVNITVNVPGGSGAEVKRQAYSGTQAAFDEYFGMLQRIHPQVTEG